jgi:tetratricopeptide (TPR) repeat protein
MTFLRSTPLSQGPTVPQIFFGRDAEVAHIVHMVTTNVGRRPARIAILGPGGYGKTTLAHAVLTADTIREHFGNARYFVSCESVISSGALLIELGKTLGLLKGGTDALWSHIHTMLSSTDTIICFDNFESPWDQDVEVKHPVEELLSRVTELSRVTVLITMRGAERPARTQWTRPFLKPLKTLDHDAAKEIWQAIAENYDIFSEKLIEAVDHVPLAIDLLSHLSQVTPPALLWKEWNSKKTKAVQTGQEHRLSNLEYSIKLSIDSGRMKANLSAKNLLGVLCILPDGLYMKHLSKFDNMLVGIDMTSCLQTLLQCSLIKLNEERYQPHPIIRHHCLNKGMLSLEHKAVIESFYITLALCNHYEASSEVYGEMVLEANNTKATLLGLLDSNYEDESTLINASTIFTEFCVSIGDHSDKVISQAVKFVQRNSGARALLIKIFYEWGCLCYYASHLEKAKEKLQEAEKLCLLSLDANSQLYVSILIFLGNVHMMQDALNDAEACYQRALSNCKDRNDIYMQGVLYSRLGELYGSQWKLDEAATLYQMAIQCHKDTNVPMSQGDNYRGLGWTYMEQNRMIEAEAALQKALELHRESNSLLGQGNDYHILGDIYLHLERPEDAITACQKALEFYKKTNDTRGQGNVYQLLGHIYLFQGKLNEAESSIKKALELYTVIQDALGQGNVYHAMGKIYVKRGQFIDAERIIEKAIELHKKAQDSVEEKFDVELLNFVRSQLKKSDM